MDDRPDRQAESDDEEGMVAEEEGVMAVVEDQPLLVMAMEGEEEGQQEDEGVWYFFLQHGRDVWYQCRVMGYTTRLTNEGVEIVVLLSLVTNM